MSLKIFLRTILLLSITFIYTANAQWIKTAGPLGAEVVDITINGNYLFAGTTHGIYRADLGTGTIGTWTVSLPEYDIQVLTSFNHSIYAGTYKGLFVSTDDGLNWEITGLSNHIVTALAVKDSLLLAGTVNGVFISQDKGSTWKEIDSGLVSTNVIALISDTNNIFVSTLYDGLYKSSNNGNSWIKTNLNAQNEITTIGLVDSLLLAATAWDNMIYLSTDMGITWQITSIGSDYNGVNNFVSYGQYIFAATYYGLYSSIDKGKTWQVVSLTGMNIKQLIINNAEIIAGSQVGVYLSNNNGSTWTEMNTGLLALDITSLASTKGKLFASSQYAFVYLSTDNGATWSKFSNGLTSNYLTGLGLGGDILLAGSGSGIYRTSASSASWSRVTNGILLTDTRSFDFTADAIFAGSDNGVLRSTDNGLTWKVIDSVQIGYSGYQAWDVLALGSTIIAGYNQKGIRISTDNGLTWNYSNTGLPNYQTVNALALVGNNIIAGGTGNGIFVSPDSGRTWSQSSLDSTEINRFLVIGNTAFAATYNGVYSSIDDGLSWKQISEGMEGYVVTSLAKTGGKIFAGVLGGPVWYRPISEVTAVQSNESNAMPKYFSLSQNYPNPFNPSTTISYALPSESKVTIKIYNLLGQEIKTLVNKMETAGNHQVTFNAGNLSSGIYLYRIQAGDFIQTKKMVLLK